MFGRALLWRRAALLALLPALDAALGMLPWAGPRIPPGPEGLKGRRSLRTHGAGGAPFLRVVGDGALVVAAVEGALPLQKPVQALLQVGSRRSCLGPQS